MCPYSPTALTNLMMNTFRSMTSLKTMTLGQTSEAARRANDENMSPPFEVSPLLRYSRAVKLALAQSMLTNILQHPSRTLLRHSHHLKASLILMLTADLVELQPRRTNVDQSNQPVI